MDEWLTPIEAAEFLRIAEKTLRNWRNLNRKGIEIGPPWLRPGRVFYRKSDLLAWIEQNLYTSTKEYGRKKPPKEPLKQPPAEPDEPAP
jgi:hypothetical protein